MAGTANVMPAQLVSVYQAVCDGELERAQAEWARIYPLMDAIMTAPFVAAIKSALSTLGCPAGSPRKPVRDLDAPTAARIAALARALPQLSPSR
jgi:4-hydroxy-tetrahydrodipicolinate synthase